MQSSDYQAISRVFRPKKFSEVTGQKATTSTLIHALQKGQTAHAYLFSGIRGTGKTTLARIFAKALNCQNRTEEGEPCNACSSCTEINSGQSLDVLEIDGASNRGIDDIRNLNETIGYATFHGKCKIFIIDEVHMLTKEAFNALLKTLEEPPKNVKFFLATTEPHKLPATVLSRCQRFDLSRISNAEMIKKLRAIVKTLKNSVSDEALAFIAKLSEGSMRDAESLLDQVICLKEDQVDVSDVENLIGLFNKSLFFDIDAAYQANDITASFSLSEKFFQSGRDMSVIVDLLFEHYRNLALILFGKLNPKDSFISETEQAGYETAATIYQKNEVLHILDYLSQTLHSSSRPLLKRIHLEIILLHILQTKGRISVVSLIEKLEALKNHVPNENVQSVDLKTSPKTEEKITPSPLPSEKPLDSSSPQVEKTSEPAPKIKQELAQINLSEPLKPPPKKPIKPSALRDTLIRFASVEIGGTLSTHS